MLPTDVEPIHASESLGRGVFSGSAARRAARSIPHHVFLERPRNRIISVDRLGKASLGEAIANAELVARSRVRTFYGWAVVSAEAASRSGCAIQASPMPQNAWHAGINLPGDDRDEQISHARELANAARWQAR